MRLKHKTDLIMNTNKIYLITNKIIKLITNTLEEYFN